MCLPVEVTRTQCRNSFLNKFTIIRPPNQWIATRTGRRKVMLLPKGWKLIEVSLLVLVTKKKKQRELQSTYNLQPATFWKADPEEDNLCSTLLSTYQRHSRMEKTLLQQKLLQKARCLFGHLFPNNIAHTRIPSVSEP